MNKMLLYFLLIFHLFLITHSLKLPQNLNNQSKSFIQCIICNNMFNYNFNFDEGTKDPNNFDTIKLFVKKFVKEPNIEELTSKNFIETNMKEIAMEYFFKGADNLFDAETNSKLINCKNRNSKDCFDLKKPLCEKILSVKCEIPKYRQESLNVNNNNNVMTMPPVLNSNGNGNITMGTKNDNQNNQKKQQFDGLLRFKEKMSSMTELSSGSGFESSSLLGLASSATANSLMGSATTSNSSSVSSNKWSPPAPILLQNFDSSIGEQLKDISGLSM